MNPHTPSKLLLDNSPATRVKPFNTELRDALRTYAQDNELNNTELAHQLGCHPTAVSKYLNGRPEGNVTRLESIVADVLKNSARRKGAEVRLFETSSTRKINSACETVRKTNDFALVTGPAGVGKSCGIQLYCRDNPATIHLEITKWHTTPDEQQSLLFGSIATRDWDGFTKRAIYLVDKFRGSNRLLLIDNIHRLRFGALQWWFDFYDATGCPIVGVGNPEVLTTLRRSDQMFSRIGLWVKLDKIDATDKIVEHVVTQVWPEANGDLNDLGAVVLENQGHVRALRKQVALARDLADNSAALRDPETAFRAAHKQLIRDYPLK